MNVYMVGVANLFEGTLSMTQIEAKNERDAIAIWLGESPGYYAARNIEQVKDDFFSGDMLIEVVKI